MGRGQGRWQSHVHNHVMPGNRGSVVTAKGRRHSSQFASTLVSSSAELIDKDQLSERYGARLRITNCEQLLPDRQSTGRIRNCAVWVRCPWKHKAGYIGQDKCDRRQIWLFDTNDGETGRAAGQQGSRAGRHERLKRQMEITGSRRA